MSEPRKEYVGELRPHVKVLRTEKDSLGIEHHVVEIKWVTPDGEVVWTETVKPPAERAIVSQITCYGNFTTSRGYFVDDEGKRHFVLPCPIGRLGVAGKETTITKE